MNIIEVVPYKQNALQKIDFYNNKYYPWLYVYRKDDATADKMIKEANAMLNSGTQFIYENPSFGWTNWCCVTFVSYLATVATQNFWKMGSNQNAYIWSPRYGYGYDEALLNMGFKKYDYKTVTLKNGDIVQSWNHAAIVEIPQEGFNVENLWTVDPGCKGCEGLVITIQSILNTKGGENLYIDGDYGPKTQAAVLRWQKKYSLYQDASVGPKTWFSLLTQHVIG